MTRIHLNEHGFPIPTQAMPEGLLSEDEIPPVTLVLEDGQNFAKQDFAGLGYTHYEVWCIGAAGGLGGEEAAVIRWHVDITHEAMPVTEWDAWLAEELRRGTFTYPPGYHFGLSDPVTGEMISLTHEELLIYQHPGRVFTVFTYHDPYALKGSNVQGGAGGGGGLHRVSGLLADLDDLTPVIVGQVGADAEPGQGYVDGLYDPSPHSYAYYPAPYTGSYGPEQHIYGWFTQRYPNVPTLLPPQPGEDGGASSFGDIAQASGGKGGAGATEWIGGVKFFGGYGGEGGSGDRTEAGGGGVGSTSSDKNGKDGTWNGTIGKGGGGGRGGRVYSSAYQPGVAYAPYGHIPVPGDGSLMHQMANQPYKPPVVKDATNGGQGSFSYGDTSVYGQRQFKSKSSTYLRIYDYNESSPNYSELVSETPRPTTYSIVPGGGGGAKAPGKRWHGSKALGCSPNGTVIIKVFKID